MGLKLKCRVIEQKSGSKKKYFEIIKLQTRFCSLPVKYTSYCSNLRAIELVPFDLELLKVFNASS